MATFLTTEDTSAAILRVIREAKKELTLISAYVYPRIIYLQRLQDAAERGVTITFLFGKKRMDDKVMALFKEVPNLRIYYLHDMHAKCFVNENEAIVTSLNLLNGSEEKNREMGVRLERTIDAQAYAECVSEVQSILKVAKLVHSTASSIPAPMRVDTSTVQTTGGYCIRTGVRIPFNVERPLSPDAYKAWNKFGNPEYPEKYCHFSGEPTDGATSMSKPILKKNWNKAKAAFGL